MGLLQAGKSAVVALPIADRVTDRAGEGSSSGPMRTCRLIDMKNVIDMSISLAFFMSIREQTSERPSMLETKLDIHMTNISTYLQTESHRSALDLFFNFQKVFPCSRGHTKQRFHAKGF